MDSCEQSTTNGTLDYRQDVDLLLNTKDAAERSKKSLINGTSDYRSDVDFKEFTINVPRTTARMATRSNSLRIATACLPMWYLYEDKHLIHLLHPPLVSDITSGGISAGNNASSPIQSDDNASLSFQPKVPISTCRPCFQPSTGGLHQKISNIKI